MNILHCFVNKTQEILFNEVSMISRLDTTEKHIYCILSGNARDRRKSKRLLERKYNTELERIGWHIEEYVFEGKRK